MFDGYISKNWVWPQVTENEKEECFSFMESPGSGLGWGSTSKGKGPKLLPSSCSVLCGLNLVVQAAGIRIPGSRMAKGTKKRARFLQAST